MVTCAERAVSAPVLPWRRWRLAVCVCISSDGAERSSRSVAPASGSPSAPRLASRAGGGRATASDVLRRALRGWRLGRAAAELPSATCSSSQPCARGAAATWNGQLCNAGAQRPRLGRSEASQRDRRYCRARQCSYSLFSLQWRQADVSVVADVT